MNSLVFCLWLVLGWFSNMGFLATISVPPLEARRDQLMEKRFSDSLAALREKDNAKTIELLKAMAHEFIVEMQKLKPHYQEWYRSLSAEEKLMLLYQVDPKKKWLLLMQKIQFDACIQHRFKENVKLMQEYERIQFLCDKAAEMEL